MENSITDDEPGMTIQHNISTESHSQFCEGIGFRAKSSHTNLDSNAISLNSLHIGISQVISGNDIDDISLLNEGRDQTIEMLNVLRKQNFPSIDTGAKLEPIESSGGTSLSSDAPYQTQLIENIPSKVEFSKSAELNIADGKCHKFNEDEAKNAEIDIEFLNQVNKATSKVLPRQSTSGIIPSKNESEVGHPSKKASDVACSNKSNVDQRELIPTANAARNASHASCSNSFWKRVEPLFSLVNQKDIDYMTQQASAIYFF
ncbi:hypothetical protein J5N97_012205 [Dioscorea zingiberensis]|uniref:Uncharacterized protein n=1 Tax=Dioscorea zingiberensis TaxID=325984 RepID=A0A9D5CNJ8_9LILI|nr:hypothetical protein J5N97_012205 [Dioscorea zingiberensis]